jgi:hypothetical protein
LGAGNLLSSPRLLPGGDEFCSSAAWAMKKVELAVKEGNVSINLPNSPATEKVENKKVENNSVMFIIMLRELN